MRIAIRWAFVVSGLALASLAIFLVYGTALVDAAMQEARVRSGTRVLSAPLELRSGAPWSAAELRRSLLERGFIEARAAFPARGEFRCDGENVTLGPGVVDGGAGAVEASCAGGTLRLGPPTAPMANARLAPSLIGVEAEHGVIRWPVPIDDVAPALLTAVVDVEDRGFLRHAGLSLRGLVRAAVEDAISGGVRQGGSTITQQVAKVLMLRPARTIPRKILEAWLAALIEYRFDKRTILETYVNRIYLGQDGGMQIEGVEAAARYYFGKRAAALDEAESALLAGMIAAPNRFDPLTHPAEATRRRAIVLGAMVAEGHLARDSADVLARSPLPREPHHFRWPPAAQPVESILASRPPSGDVVSTIDPDIQAAISTGCSAGLEQLEAQRPRLRQLAESGDPLQVAVVAMTPDGRVRGLIGSRSGAPGEFNRATSAARQVGSLVKPFIVAAALEQGWWLDSEVLDEPLTVAVGDQEWTPRNDDGTYRGVVTVRDALALSLNVAMVRLGLELSLPSVIAVLGRVGFDVRDRGPAILLGAFEASPIEVAQAFAGLAGGGKRPVVTLVESAMHPPAAVLAPTVAAQVLEAMREVVRRGTAAALADRYGGRLAAKTGTTDDRRDAWFVGVTAGLVIVVWVGTDRNQETGLYGATGAMAVWQAIVERMPRSAQP